MYTEDIMSYFPLENPRKGQIAVIKEIDKVFKSGKKFIVFEGPVGCGKSAIAMTFAKAFGDAHMITPRKSLQNQYYSDFSDDVVLMKGRNSYPCTFNSSPKVYKNVIKLVKEGHIKQPAYGEENCSNGPCKGNKEIYALCTEDNTPCPYTVAMETAQEHNCVIHNLHSFIYQTAFTEKFSQRELLVIDEAHEIQTIIRDFISKKIGISKVIKDTGPDNPMDIDSWCDFFLKDEFIPKLSNGEKAKKELDPNWISPSDEYVSKITNFRAQKDYYSNKFCVKTTINKVGNQEISTTFEFVPDSLGNTPTNLLFSMGNHVLLMSGTIYDKNVFCRNLGLNPEDVHFIRISSTFPVENRPIYLKPEYQVDTSFANWNENFEEMIEKIEKISSIFDDAKGLIHAPSYDAARQIVEALPRGRYITHDANNFQEKLEEFFNSESNQVFISPVCQQGVDFKQDRARFQIVLRIPYLSTSDEFVNYKVQNDFAWYNYEALVIFGQQLGRVNRSEDDYGATFLMDSRFNRFISRNSKVLPKWVQQGFIWR